LIVAAVVAAGFGPTLGARLIRPPSPRPWILYVHVALFTSWVVLFILQSTLIRLRRVQWHRRLGRLIIPVGILMPPVGIATGLAMTRLHMAEGQGDGPEFLILTCYDMIAFAIAFGLAVHWQHRPEFHRRLMLVATCGLTVAAFARFPDWLMPTYGFYPAADALILAAAVRDRMTTGRIHPVYLYALPLAMAGQAIAMAIYLSALPAWMAIARQLLAWWRW
jgi:hypothetical protein